MGTTRRTVVAATVVAGVLLLGGCGREPGTEGRDGGAAKESGVGESERGIPPELVGSWSTDHSNEFEPTIHGFYEDGFFTSEIGATRITGRYEVRGDTILTRPDEGEPQIYAWRMGEDGCLYLNGARHCPYS